MAAMTSLAGSPVIERWVDGFWALESSGTAHRILPDGCIDFIFDLDSGLARAQGAMTRAEIVAVPAGRRLFGIRFLPGAAGMFIDAHARALEDRDVDLDDISYARAWRLGERVAEAPDHASRLRLLGQFVLDPRARKRAADARLKRAVHLVRQSRGTWPVSAIAREVGLSERTLERLFGEHVGVRPKVFARIVRMEWTRAHAESHATSQASLALWGGYADEPHLLREFRSLTGLTPGALLAEGRVGFVQVDGAVCG
jgi:AraC-like DNA-binding protein